MTEVQLPLPLLGTLLFSLMGPIGLMPLFAKLTAGADRALQIRIALMGAMIGFVAICIAVFSGAGAMAGTGTQPPALIIAAGLMLVMTALRNVFGGGGGHGDPGQAPPPSMGLALSPLAIPGIVTPVGVAILIIFVSYFPDMSDKLAILGVVAGIMVANIICMLGAHWFMRVIGIAPLVVLGAVFGVLQVATGIQMMLSGLKLSRILG